MLPQAVGRAAAAHPVLAAVPVHCAPVLHGPMVLRATVVLGDRETETWCATFPSNTTVSDVLLSLSRDFFSGKPLAAMHSVPRGGDPEERFANAHSIGDLGLVPLIEGGNKFAVTLKLPTPKTFRLVVNVVSLGVTSRKSLDVPPDAYFMQTVAQHCDIINLRNTQKLSYKDGQDRAKVVWPSSTITIQHFVQELGISAAGCPFEIFIEAQEAADP